MLMMVILFVLGMFIDWVGILLLTVPIFLPIMKSLRWDGLFGLPGVRPRMCRSGTVSSSWSTCRWRFSLRRSAIRCSI